VFRSEVRTTDVSPWARASEGNFVAEPGGWDVSVLRARDDVASNNDEKL